VQGIQISDPPVGGLHRGDRDQRGAGGDGVCYVLQWHLPDADLAADLRVEGKQDAGEVTGDGQHLAAVGQFGRDEPGER